MTENSDHQKNIRLQAREHPLIQDRTFRTIEEYVLHLMHLKSYETVTEICLGKDVLDWGCNVGYGMEVLAKKAASIAGLDLSERAVIAARERMGVRAKEIQYYNGKQCRFADQTFDVVTSFQVLEHVSDYETYFNEIIRVLRPGGVAIFATPNALLRLAPQMKPWNEFHIHEFSPAELRELLASHFQSVNILGLFAMEQIYKIERDRVERAKQRALVAQHSRNIVKPLKAIVRQYFPFSLRIRNAVTRTNQVPIPELSLSDLARFSTMDLYYRDENLDGALDLMAVCKKSYCKVPS